MITRLTPSDSASDDLKLSLHQARSKSTIVNLPHTPSLLRMLSRQALLRARTPALRNAVQRRFASTDGLPKLEGAMDNAFNRERQAVKAHAAKSAGEFFSKDDQLSVGN